MVKASGLAAGKGVIICESKEEAEREIRDMLSGNSFGESGSEVVIEEFLEGEEASLHLICSGEEYVTLPMSQDHKKAGEGDTGLNTGGMGAYAPTSLVTPSMLAEYEESIVRPTLGGLKAEEMNFRGTLYIGLMLTARGPKVLEFNVRFGDPETRSFCRWWPVGAFVASARENLSLSSYRSKKNLPWLWCWQVGVTPDPIPKVKKYTHPPKPHNPPCLFMPEPVKTRMGISFPQVDGYSVQLVPGNLWKMPRIVLINCAKK